VFIRDLIHDVVHTVENNLKVDWTKSHRESVKATVWAAVRRDLPVATCGKRTWSFLGYTLHQGKKIYADWLMSVYVEAR
jgi:hypothetical protein